MSRTSAAERIAAARNAGVASEPPALQYQTGFANHFASEALTSALPEQNSPQRSPIVQQFIPHAFFPRDDKHFRLNTQATDKKASPGTGMTPGY